MSVLDLHVDTYETFKGCSTFVDNGLLGTYEIGIVNIEPANRTGSHLTGIYT
jgi:hypothetical protein